MKRMLENAEALGAVGEFVRQDGKTTVFGGNVYVDGNANVEHIHDKNGEEAIDIATQDVSVSKNLNVGDVGNPKDLFVSGKFVGVKEYKCNHNSLYVLNETVIIPPAEGKPGISVFSGSIKVGTNYPQYETVLWNAIIGMTLEDEPSFPLHSFIALPTSQEKLNCNYSFLGKTVNKNGGQHYIFTLFYL